MVEVTIDSGSGFCFGVVKAIQSAERELKQTDKLYMIEIGRASCRERV